MRETELQEWPSESRDMNPLKEAQVSQRNAIIQACIDELPDLYRSVLNQFYWLERSVDEIAESLAVPGNTVKSYLHRARHRLNVALKRRGIDDER